jgi:hypothetical protein
MEDDMLARAAAPRSKRRFVQFRTTRSPRDVLISLPFRQPSDCARTPVSSAKSPRSMPMQHDR